MDLRNYQKRAFKTNKFAKDRSPERTVASVLGLGSETGSVLDMWKRYLRDQVNLEENKNVLEIELGDLLWYVAVVARYLDLDLGEIARKNLGRASDLYGDRGKKALRRQKVLDRRWPLTERFPRRMVVRFSEASISGHPHAALELVAATPNAFPKGPVPNPSTEGQKLIGYEVGAALGEVVNDNSRRTDHYRYHDAIHLGFMAVLGWSPTMRALLRIKRKSKKETDRVEDGARAVYLEEGLAAVLAKMSLRRGRFKSETTIDGEVIDVAKHLTRDLEVASAPGWLWRRAIVAGFYVMDRLAEFKGGFVIANLDSRTLEYSRVRPR